MPTEPLALEAAGIEKRLRRRPILRGVEFTLRRAEIVGLSGENGSGKSTLMRVFAGLLGPDRGTVRHHGTLGYAPQLPLLYELLTVWEHFRYVAAARGMPAGTWERRAETLLERYRFDPWRSHRVAALSGGTQQKLNLSLTFLADPEILLLDEPYGGFEWDTYLHFWEHVRELRDAGRAIVVVSHLFFDRAGVDRLLVLRGGRLEPGN